ncbi:MAG: phospholipid carrier-dependent glycosyltransferase [Chloroflexi bacterium]|nr:MAG: phospholipid carrier-dependent glycosyltransferase [Chloroflexota bacterium]
MSRLTHFALLIISLAAALALWYATPAGLGLTNDSVAYIGGARSIMAGTGYSDIWLDSSLEPITHYPPLLSLTLSGLGLLGLDPLRGARLLNIFLFGANTFLVGLLGWRMTRSQPSAFLLALLFALNATFLRLHAYALSEPLFLFFSLLSFLFFDFSFNAPASLRITRYSLLVTGFLASLAFLTRYSGLALIATFAFALFLYQPDWRSRFTKIAQFLAGAVLPMSAWFIRNALVAESATNRTFQFHPIQAENLVPVFYNLSQFLMPVEDWRRALVKSGLINWILVFAGLSLLTWLVFQAYRLIFHRPVSLPGNLPFTTSLYVFAYLGAILFSMSFFDASTKFQPRILAPLYVSGMLLLVGLLNFVHGTHGKVRIFSFDFSVFLRLIRVPIILLIAILALGLSTFDFRLTLAELRDSAGLGYGSWKWRDSIVMADLKNLSADTAIYTNTPPAVYLVTGRASRVIPTTLDPVDNLPRNDYEQNLAQMRADLLAGRAVLALFDTSNIEEALGAENVDQFISGLVVLQKAQGDVLYGKP